MAAQAPSRLKVASYDREAEVPGFVSTPSWRACGSGGTVRSRPENPAPVIPTHSA